MRKTKGQSGAEKNNKRQRLEAAAQSQKRVLWRNSQIHSENQTPGWSW